MTTLRKIQQNFISDCLSGELSQGNMSMQGDINEACLSAKAQMAIYRESSIGNIIIAMQITYPVIEKLVGSDFFRASCRQYSQQDWPKTANMEDYGQGFAEFLAAFEPAKSLPYLADVARLEWLCHESSIAGDLKTSDWAVFSQLSEEQIAHTQIILHPTARFIYSDYPINEIWGNNQPGLEQAEPLDLDQSSGVYLVVQRQSLKVEVLEVSLAEFKFLQALLKGAALYEAAELAIEIDPVLDMQRVMGTFLQNGLLCQFKKASP